MKKLIVIIAVLGLFWVSADCQRHKPFATAKYMFSQFFSGRSFDGMVVISSGLKPSVSLMAEMVPVTDDSGVILLPEDDYYPAPGPVVTPVPPANNTNPADEALREAQRQMQEALRKLQEMQERQSQIINSISRF
jgi:hypothetical protein